MARAADAEAMAEIYAPVVNGTGISFELVPPTADEFRERIRTTLESTPWLVYEQSGRVIGYAYAGRWRARAAYQWTAEVSAYVSPAAQGRGVGPQMCECLLALLRLQGYQTAVSGVTLPNERSTRLHEKLGFSQVGTYHKVGFKLGRWWDVAWWEKQIGERPLQPLPPKPVTQLTEQELQVAFQLRPEPLMP